MYNNTYVIFQFECLRVIVPDLIGFGKSDKFVDYRAYNIRQGNFNVILLNFVCLSVWNIYYIASTAVLSIYVAPALTRSLLNNIDATLIFFYYFYVVSIFYFDLFFNLSAIFLILLQYSIKYQLTASLDC